jgi:cytochrome c oxidase subunit II
MKVPLFPEQASTTAAQVDMLYFFLIALSAFFVALIFLPMAGFLVKYRRGRRANRTPLRIPTLGIEVAWTVIPLLLMLATFGWAARLYLDIRHPPADALEIHVVGKQWMWKVQHPAGNREINELHVPVGRNVKLILASEDVIHSFFLPAFRIKQDVVPGRFTQEWFQATRVGVYRLFCAEYCGMEHSRMAGRVYVLPPEEYQQWLRSSPPHPTLVALGERLFRERGCSGCHLGSSIVRAPPLEGLYGKPVPLQSGQFVTADEKYLRDSILLPQSQVAAGYEPLMPTYQGFLTEEELLQLVAYIKSLAPKPPEATQ